MTDAARQRRLADAERKRRERGRIKAGLVLVQAWVPAHAGAAVLAAIERAVHDAAEQADRAGKDE